MSLITDLTAYYKLDGSSVDSIGLHNGTDTNITYSVGSGKINQGAECNGTSSKILISSTNIFNRPVGSISFWVNTASLTTSQRIVGDIGGYIHFSIRETVGNGKIGFFIFDNTSTSKVVSTDISVNTWTHITGTWDGANIILYKNGGSVSSLSCDIINSGVNGSSCWISSNGAGFGFLNGYIDEVGIWSRSLSASEISQLYNSGSGLSYPFDQSNFFNLF